MTDTTREAVERLLDEVTEGPWRALSNNEVWRDGFGDLGLSVFDRVAMAEATFTTRMGRRHCTGEAAANARFIAAARELVPALLARAEAAEAALTAERDRLRAALAEADRRIAWEAHGFGNDFAERVEAALKGESHD